MPTLFLDENVKVELADALVAAGYPCRTTVGEGWLGKMDADLVRFCADHGWVCVTQNRRDFLTLHEAWVSWTAAWNLPLPHNGILILDQGPLVPVLMAALVPFLAAHPDLTNQLWNWYDTPPEWQEFTLGGSRKRRPSPRVS